jgi:hypothetical protein
MVHTTRGRPNLGNAQFALRLDQAPFNSLTWCIIGGGPCGPPGVVVPPLCGPIFTGPVLGTIGSVPTPPGVGCGATAIYPLPLPMIPSLCGAILSSQCVAFCFAGGAIGTSLSNCLSWQLQSN